MPVIELTKENFDKEVMQSELPTIVDFWASWCGPCRMMGPIIEEIAHENPEIKVCKVNVDNETELAARFGIMSIPTVIAFKNGEIVNKTTGVRPKSQIVNMLD